MRIGLLSTSGVQRLAGVKALTDGLKGLGYGEHTFSIESRDGQGRNDQLPALASELVELGCAVIIALGPYAIQAASGASTTIPIVFTGIGANFALTRNARNMTGVVEELIESSAKRLALLGEAIPVLGRVGIIANPDNYGTLVYLRQCQAWARSSHATVHAYDLRDPDDVFPAFTRMSDDRIEAIVVFPDSVIFGQRDRIAQTALNNNLPGIYIYREWVAAGGLFAYGANQEKIIRKRVSEIVAKILEGAMPGDLPLQRGELELFINLKTANAMNVDFPRSLVARADEVIA